MDVEVQHTGVEGCHHYHVIDKASGEVVEVLTESELTKEQKPEEVTEVQIVEAAKEVFVAEVLPELEKDPDYVPMAPEPEQESTTVAPSKSEATEETVS